MTKNLRSFILTITITSSVIVAVVVIGLAMKEEKVISLGPEVSKETETNETAIIDNEEEKMEEKKKLPEEQKETNWRWLNRQKKLFELAPTETSSILKELQQKFPNKPERLKALSILRLGTPYQLGCLGEESGRDKDPIFRLDVTDCTAFILTNVALLHSQDLKEAREMMKYLNYREAKETTFEDRLHFTTDRNMVSSYFEDITAKTVCGCKLKTINVILNKIKADGKRLIDIDWEKEIILKYIPNNYITKNLFSNLPEVLGIAFIEEGDEKIGLDVRHEGFLFSSEARNQGSEERSDERFLFDGEILYHASSVEKKVVAVDFFNYYFGKDGDSPKFDGIILFEIK